MSDKPNSVVSLFSGAGGFDLGFHLAGFTTHLACELLAEPANTLATNLGLEIIEAPAAPSINGRKLTVQGDVRDVDFSNIGFVPDVLIGGPPCQDFSTVKGGKQEGVHGRRGRLYLEFMRAVIQLQPKFFVFENVPGLISANKGEVFDIIRHDLGDLGDPARLTEICDELEINSNNYSQLAGYDILFDGVIDAPTLGVPQTRRRLIIVGVRRDLFDRFHILKQYQLRDEFNERLHGRRTLFPVFPLTSLEVFEGKPLPELEDKYRGVMQAYNDLVLRTDIPAVESWLKETWAKLTLDIRADYFTANNIPDTTHRRMQYEQAMEEHDELLKELGWRNVSVKDVKTEDGTNEEPKITQEVIQRMYMIPPDHNYQFVDNTDWRVVGKGISFIYRRSAPLKPAWTVVAYGGGGTHGYHYERNRAQLTLRERARIQTFTDDYLFIGPGVRAQIGEAVPPLMGKRIAEAILELLNILK